MNLLQQLNDLQTEHGWLPDEVLRRFSAEAGVPLYRIQEVASFYPHYRLEPPPKATVSLCRDAACHIGGGPAFMQEVKAALAGRDDIEVHEVSCLGRCEHAPAACVDEVPLLGASAEDVVKTAQGEQALPADEPTDTPRRWASDPYETTDARYGVLRALMADAASRADVPDQVAASGLRGMGGAGFPAGLKWRFVRDTPGEVKYVVCNADESEPGAFKDRVILEELPHLVIEGMLIACLVAGGTDAIVYIRHEYDRERKAIQAEIDRVKAMGLTAELGVDLSVFVSPGGYILGEETALIEALEGKRGEPRNKPPFPTTHGVHGKPTLMNNVETFSHVPLILQEGPETWKAHGVNGGNGWKFVSLCGHVEKPGVYLVPMGTTVQDLVDEHGGGIQDGKAMKAYYPGGASAPFLPASKADTPLEWDAMEKAGSMLGSGSVLVVAEGTDMLDLATNVVRFFRNESCGKCVPCRVGSQKAVAILDDVLAGRGGEDAFALFPELDEALRLTSICGLGQVVLNPATSVLEHFPEDVAKHTQNGGR
ncbi:MAG: NADH-ubiquinone oxidoreductase-F iron-sulfur binding region domain-containing protein [Planctomycetota bacterium]|nr:NADH-ubiquinone oxidoreductase-F iron-sulfur binding region domain-containing protein [Planctomycetota bacterium]